MTAADLSYYEEIASDIINVIGRDCFIYKPVNNEDIIRKLKFLLTEKSCISFVLKTYYWLLKILFIGF